MSLLEDVRVEATRSGASASAIAARLGADEFLVAAALRALGASPARSLSFTAGPCGGGACADRAPQASDASAPGGSALTLPKGCKGCPFAPSMA